MTLSCSFSKSTVKNSAVAWADLPITLQSQSVITSGTVSVPTHAYVPVPFGALSPDDVLVVIENGTQISSQQEVVQTWDDLGTPKWLHVHFLGAYDNGVARAYLLRRSNVVVSTALTVTDDGTNITIANGFVKLVISKLAYSGVQELWYDHTGVGSYGSPVLNTTLGGPTYTDEHGLVWRPQYHSPIYIAQLGETIDTLPQNQVTVEESGSVKVTVTVKGFYQPPAAYQPHDDGNAAANSVPLVEMAFTDRITVYAGLPNVYFQHANTPTQYLKTQQWPNVSGPTQSFSSWDHPLADIAYSLPLTGATSYSLGVDGSTIGAGVSSRNTALTDDCVAFYKFQDMTLKDEVYQNSLTVADGSPSVATGLVGNALVCNGATSCVIPESNAMIGGARSFAVSGWVKFTSLSCPQGLQSVFSKWNYQPGVYDNSGSVQQTCAAYLTSGQLNFAINTSETTTPVVTVLTFTSSDLVIAVNTWYHCTLQWDEVSGTMTAVVNGHKKTATLTGLPARSPKSLVSFGAGNPNGGPPTFHLTGLLDSWGVWAGRTLSDAEISSLDNSGAGLDYPFGLSLDGSSGRYANPNAAYMHQYRHANVRLLGAAASHDTGSLQKSDGWCEAVTGSYHALLVSKNAWQKFPKELEVSSAGIVHHQWPQHGISTFTMSELLSQQNLYKFWGLLHGQYYDSQVQPEVVMMYQVGPGAVCTFATGTNIVTTLTSHGWSSGQAVYFLPGNANAVFPTTTPQITYNHFYFTQTAFNNNYYGTDGPYYIQVLSPTTFKVFTDSGLTQQVTFSGAGSGTLLVGTKEFQSEAPGFANQESYPGALLAVAPAGSALYDEFALVLSQSGVNNLGYQQLYSLRPIAAPSATWCAASGCLGPMAAIGSDFSSIESALKKSVVSYCDFDRALDYGHFNFGDTHHEWYTDLGRAGLYRCPMNSHYFLLETLWTMYFRSGDVTLLSLARSVADHYVSVDTLRPFGFQGNPPFTPFTGFGFDHCKGEVHWGGDVAGWGEHFGDSDGLLLSWLIGADRWHKQAFDDFVEQTYTQGYQNIDLQAKMNALYPQLDASVPYRDYVGPLKRLVTAYQHTRDARLLPGVYITAAAASSVVDLNPAGVTGPLWHPRWVSAYYEQTRDPSFLPFITNIAETFGLSVEETTMAVRATAVSLGLVSAVQYVTPHVQLMTDYPNIIANLPGNPPYDGFGTFPGPAGWIGDGYRWLCWPYMLEQARLAGISSVDPTTAADYHGAYFVSGVQDIFIQKSTSASWVFTLATYSLGGDVGNMTIQAQGPVSTLTGSGPTVFSLGNYQPQNFTGFPNRISIDISSGIVTTASAHGWTTGQFVSLEATDGVDTSVVLPKSSYAALALHTPQLYVHVLSSNTVRLYADPTDAINDANRISFTTIGANLALMPRGNFTYPAVFTSPLAGDFTVPGDAGGGVYRVVVTGGDPIVMPMTGFPEAQLVGPGTYQATRVIGVLTPLQSYPISITVTPTNDQAAVTVLIADGNGATVASASLLVGQTSPVVATINNSDGHVNPWTISVVGPASVAFAAVHGQLDTDLFLFGPSAAGNTAIKNALGL